jgi:hypothetical protein
MREGGDQEAVAFARAQGEPAAALEPQVAPREPSGEVAATTEPTAGPGAREVGGRTRQQSSHFPANRANKQKTPKAAAAALAQMETTRVQHPERESGKATPRQPNCGDGATGELPTR